MDETEEREENVAFASFWKPAVEVGEYVLEVEQTAIGINGFEKDRAECRLMVGGERFRLAPDAVYSAYPAPNSLGEFKNTFPHLVLHSPVLPWRRRIYRSDDQPLPWLCLVLVDETEDAAARETTLAEALREDDGVFVPRLVLDSHEDPEAACTVLEMPTQLFREILPPLEDLPFTAHVRIVNLDDKVTDPTVNGEAFSCLLANRFSREPDEAPAGDGAESLRHTVHVVSLEGFAPSLYGEADIRQPRVRMFSLHHWSYYVTRSQFDFKTVMEAMDVGVLKPAPAPAGTDAALVNLLNLGFIPMNHRLRDGSRTVSWYRGPLCPAEPRPAADYTGEPERIAFLPDENLRYDPHLGMLDVSYAAAWQTGRLLALQNQDLAAGLMRWRMAGKLKAVTDLNEQALARHLPDENAVSSAQAVYARLLADNAGHSADDTGFRGTRYEKALTGVARRMGRQTVAAAPALSQEELIRMGREAENEELA